jgi:predicted ATPase
MVFKTVGDAFCAVFGDPEDAIASAVDAQRALAAEAWPTDIGALAVRMALHAGAAEERDGDYFGPVVNRVARLLAAGHGGQVLLSAVVEGLVAGGIPVGVRLLDLGEHRLKDLARPERIFQVVASGLSGSFPPPRTLDRVLGNLPIQLTSFVGRERELADLEERIGRERLVTLTGAGGAGKTRLALALAAGIADRFPDGAWFVDLAPLTDPERVADAVGEVLGARNLPCRPTGAALAEHVRRRRMLVVLDNCEQVVTGAAAVAATLVSAGPGVTVLATGREPLAVTGELVVPLAPLASPTAVPDAGDEAALARFAELDAVRLFAERAAAAAPSFRVTSANAAAVADICRRLDGIPLALELAAARVRGLSPEEIARRLDQRFGLLTGGARDRLPRQQTLRGAIDWSYEPLPELERLVLQRMSVFAGAIPLAAVEAVAGSGDIAYIADVAVVDAVSALVAKSLVVTQDHLGDTRYRLLETIRAYAAEKLAAGEGEGAARQRQLAWYRSLAAQARIARPDAEFTRWRERFGPLRDDLAGAVTWALAQPGGAATAAEVVAAAWWLVVWVRPMFALVERVFDAADAQGLADGQPMLVWLAASGYHHAHHWPEAAALSDRAVRLALARGDRALESWARQDLAAALFNLGDTAAARREAEAAVQLRRGLGDDLELSIALTTLGEVERGAGDLSAALRHNEDALALLSSAPLPSIDEGWLRHNTGQLLLQAGQVEAGRGHLLSAIGLFRRDPHDPVGIASCLAGLAGVAAAQGDGRRAARLLGAAAHLLDDEGVPLERCDEADRARHEAATRALLDGAEWEAAFEQGWVLSRDEAMAAAIEESP